MDNSRRDSMRLREKQRKRKRLKILRGCIIVAVAVLICAAVAAAFIARAGGSTKKAASEPKETTSVKPTEDAAQFYTEEPTPEPTQEPIQRRGTAQSIPDDIRALMSGHSMPSNATIGYDDLAYLTIPHYDFNYNITEGHMVVNKAVAEEVLDIFAELFDIQYPIERMELIDKYNADDFTSIEYNNTSAFNYRVSTDGSGRLSKHALGRAIDINPQQNPYVSSNGTGSHSNAREYWSRNPEQWSDPVARAAYIGPGTGIYDIFVNKHGWEWGGSWSSYRDYQHFQKMQ